MNMAEHDEMMNSIKVDAMVWNEQLKIIGIDLGVPKGKIEQKPIKED